MEELVELGPGAEVGRGLLPLSRDSRGIFVSDPSPKSLRLRPGDRVVAARVSLDGATPEAVWRLLEGAGACRVSLHLRRATKATPGATTASPGATRAATTGATSEATSGASPGATKATRATTEATGASPGATKATPGATKDTKDTPGATKATKDSPGATKDSPGTTKATKDTPGATKATKDSPGATKDTEGQRDRMPTPKKKKPAPPSPTAALELALPKLPKLPLPPPSPPPLPHSPPPLLEVAAPRGSLALSPPQILPPKFGGGPHEDEEDEDEEGSPRRPFRVPSLPIHAPRPSLELVATASPPPQTTSPPPQISTPPPQISTPLSKFTRGLRKLEPPGVEIAPKPPKIRLPRLAWNLGKWREGAASPPHPHPPQGVALKVPKLSLSPFGDTDVATPAPFPLPKFGGSSPDLRPKSPKFAPKRGGSAESLIPARAGPAGISRLKPKIWGVPPSSPTPPKARGSPPRISIPDLGFALPGPEPPEIPQGGFGLKIPKFGVGGAAPPPPRRRPKFGKIRVPHLELCPGDPQISGGRCRPGEGNPKFQLPQLVLSPQICGEP